MKKILILLIAGLFVFLNSPALAGGPSYTGGGAGDVATDTIWDAAGDLVQGTGANAAAKLPAGAAGKVLRAAGAGVAVDWSGYVIALPTTAGHVLTADGTNWVSSAPAAGGETYGHASWSAGGLIPDTCSGLLQYKATNNQFDYLAFDGATDEFATFVWFPPDNWDRGTIKAKFIWAAGAAMTDAHTVIWGLAGYTVRDGDTLNNAITAGEQTVSDYYVTDDETGPVQKITDPTPPINIAGTHALGNPVYFRVRRDAVNDTSTVDAWLIGVRIQHTKTTETPW